jgi:CHAT domain-containing protein/Tfp pilus assembly protein PilF
MSLFPQRLVTCCEALLCGLLLLAQPLHVTSRAAASDNAYALTQAVESETLTARQVHRREISEGEVHTYTFELAAHQFANFSVNQQGSDVVVTIIDAAGGRTRVDRPNGSRGRESISYIAATGGTYRLEVRTLERAAPRGYYEITLNEPRPATARDESQLAAERAVSEGETLRARKTATSLPQALEKFGQAIDLWRALDEPYETAVALYGKCLAHRMLGENEEAITDCGESAETMRALGDNYGEAVARTGKAWAYIYLGDTGKALIDFDESLKIRRRISDGQGETLDLLGIGWVQVLRGDYDSALDYFQQSIRVLDNIGDQRGRHVRLEAIGEVYRRTGRPAQAVEYLTQALRLARAAGSDSGGEAETLTGIGWCHYTLGQLGQAQDAFAEALPIRRAIGDHTGEAATMLGLAHVERARGNLYNARVDVDAALTIIESLRARVVSRPLRLSFFAMAQDYYEFYVDLLMRMHRLTPDRGYAAAALEVSERARARSLLDLLNEVGVDVRQGAPADLLERERSIRLRLNSAANYQRQLLSETYTAAQAAAAAKDIEELSAELGEVEARIRRVSPRYAELTQPQPLKAAQIQREVADDDTLLLEYALGRERSFLWAVSAEGVTAYELPGGQEIEQTAARVRESLTARNRISAGETSKQRRARVEAADAGYEEAATRLSDLLITPAAAQLKAKRLVIVATGVLQLIPFGALPAPQSSAGGYQPLILDHELVTLPSASTLSLLRREWRQREPPKKLLAILADPVFSRADERFAEEASRNPTAVGVAVYTSPAGYEGRPDGGLPRLFRTRWEAEQIAALAAPGEVVKSLDFEANREAAVGPAVEGSRIIHFATHAILDDEHPELSGIALSMFDADGRPRDGFLRAHDIFNLKLSADLVTLSACRSALGRDYKGEGLIGLTRSFMYAGATRVLGSLWSSDDKATAELMVRFYRKMLKENLRPAAALRAAQISMLRDKRWPSPYYWAGFTLQGEWH